ncbi:transcription initiation factor IIB [Stetteria hydrogenophila]
MPEKNEKGKKAGEGLPPCPPEEIVYDPWLGVKICRKYGYIIEEGVISDDAEWRAYTPEEKQRRSRVGTPLSVSSPNYGADSMLARRYGTRLPQKVTRLIRGSGFASAGVTGNMDRNINQALSKIKEIAASLGLPDYVAEEAARIYREAAARGLTRGRSINAMAAAAVFAACRIHNLPYTLEDIAKVVDTREADPKREIGRNFRLLVRDLDLKIPVIKPELYVSRIASALGLPEDVQAAAMRIIEIAKKYGLTAGKDPGGLAAAAVYMAAQKKGYKKTQKEVASVSGVTEVTVRNRYKELMKILKTLGAEAGV